MRNRGLYVALLGAVLTLALAPAALADGVPFTRGDVMAGAGNGMIDHMSPTGTLLDTLNTTHAGSEDAGMCFDGQLNMYATVFQANSVSKFTSAGNLALANFGSGYNLHPESCVVDAAGNIYVGQADGSTNILKFSPSGTLLATFAPTTGASRGTDWIDLAADQCTMHYAGEGTVIKTFNVCTNTQGPDFATGLPGGACFANRILPDQSVLVACESEALHLSSTGAVLKTYTVPGTSFLFALNLDPDGQTFWTADISNGTVARVNIATGAVVTTFNAPHTQSVAGLAIVGEPTAASDPAPTGTATAVHAIEGKSFNGGVASFSDADTTATASQYTAQVNWGDGKSSTGTVSGSGGHFTVTGSHTYAEEGSTHATVKLTDTDNTSNTATATSPVTVTDAALSAKGVNKSSGKSFKGRLAKFSDADPAGTKSDYTAQINWGDGSTSSGSIGKKGKKGKKFTVSGKHKYAKNGKYKVTVTIKDKGGATATAHSTIKITGSKALATLSGLPSSCDAGGKHSLPVNLTIQGSSITSVNVLLDGQTITVTTVKSGKQYQASFNLSLGNHNLQVTVNFQNHKAQTFNQSVSACETTADPLLGGLF